jgi:hypothetical protein
MKTVDFFTSVSSNKLKENFEKQFGSNINLNKYSREQLEDMRNKIRTRVFQQEGSSGFNDLLTNETYQKDQALLKLLNTRIKEMLGEDIKKLRDRMVELSEAKKGVKAPKYTKKAKGADKDYDGDGKVEAPKDEVWGSRAKAAAKAGKPFSEAAKPDFLDMDKDGDKKEPMKKAVADKKVKEATKTDKPWTDKSGKTHSGTAVKGTKYTGKEAEQEKKDTKVGEAATKCNHTPKGEKCPVHGLKECGTMEAKEKPSAGMTKKEKSAVVKKAKAGGDIGKPGKGFKDVEAAAKKGGAKDPKAVAAAAMWKQQAKENFKRNVKMVNESLERMIAEDEEGKAKAITAASDMVNDFTSWMQRVGQYQTKAIVELADAIKADFGAQEAETFKQSVAPALAATLETLTQQREAISNAVAVLAGEATPEEPMGMEPEMGPAEPGMEPAEPDMMNEPEAGGDEFGAAEGPSTSREVRESKFAKKLAESHSIISKLAK